MWATGDTLTATINGKDLVLTVGAAINVADVVAAVAAAINANAAGENLVGSESRNVGGQEIAEFQEIEALDQSPNIAVRVKTAGKPVTITFAANTAGTGDVGAKPSSQPPPGPITGTMPTTGPAVQSPSPATTWSSTRATCPSCTGCRKRQSRWPA